MKETTIKKYFRQFCENINDEKCIQKLRYIIPKSAKQNKLVEKYYLSFKNLKSKEIISTFEKFTNIKYLLVKESKYLNQYTGKWIRIDYGYSHFYEIYGIDTDRSSLGLYSPVLFKIE